MSPPSSSPTAIPPPPPPASSQPIGDDKKVISEEVSHRICVHMNEDHAVSVYAMAKSQGPKPEPGWKMTTAILKNVTMTGATIDMIWCRGDACRSVPMIYPFVPPLTEPHQIRSRMVAIHHHVCRPIYCYDHTLFPAIVVFYLTSLYYTVMSSRNGTADTDPTLVRTMRDCCILMSMAHMGMALYGTYLSYVVMKFKPLGTFHWFIAIILSGWLGLKELMQLVQLNETSKAKSKQDKETKSS
jgi:hypothetical protein